jgi:hypothetical protein
MMHSEFVELSSSILTKASTISGILNNLTLFLTQRVRATNVLPL